jgi:hypothetical protein
MENSGKKYSPNKFLPVRRNRIALQYTTRKQDTSRYREETQTKFKYPAETTTNAAKIPRQMSLFIKQDQITSNLRNDSETTATQGKRHIPIPRGKNTRQIQNNQLKIFVISRLTSTKQHQHKTLTN